MTLTPVPLPAPPLPSGQPALGQVGDRLEPFPLASAATRPRLSRILAAMAHDLAARVGKLRCRSAHGPRPHHTTSRSRAHAGCGAAGGGRRQEEGVWPGRLALQLHATVLTLAPAAQGAHLAAQQQQQQSKPQGVSRSVPFPSLSLLDSQLRQEAAAAADAAQRSLSGGGGGGGGGGGAASPRGPTLQQAVQQAAEGLVPAVVQQLPAHGVITQVGSLAADGGEGGDERRGGCTWR